MQSLKVFSVCAFIFLCNVEGSLHECGEFNQHGVLSSVEKAYLESIVEDFINVYSRNDTRLVNKMYNFMEMFMKNDTKKPLNMDKILKFVVRFYIAEN